MGRLLRLVVHCTATPEGREVSSEEIRRWHTAPKGSGGRGWKQVGYTDMVHLDGTVERLVPNNGDGTVDPWEVTNGAAGYNSTSLHVVYVGGVAKDGKTPEDTRTDEQKRALERYVRDFRYAHPGADIVGHRDLDPSKACPSYDVRKEYAKLIKKKDL